VCLLCRLEIELLLTAVDEMENGCSHASRSTAYPPTSEVRNVGFPSITATLTRVLDGELRLARCYRPIDNVERTPISRRVCHMSYSLPLKPAHLSLSPVMSRCFRPE
jgi:hypothetical protein